MKCGHILYRNFWTSTFCKQILNRSDRPRAASQAPVAWMWSNIMKAIGLPLKNRLYLEVEMILLNADAILASSTSKSGKDFPPIDATSKDRLMIFAISTFVDPRHCEFKHRCAHTHTIDSPTLKVTRVRIFSEVQFRDSTPRSFHQTILRTSSSNAKYRIPCLIFHGKSRSRHCWTVRFSSHGTFGAN